MAKKKQKRQAAETYAWKPGSIYEKLSARNVGALLDQLKERNNGAITPALIVDAARPANSIIHAAFDWNDSSAAEKYRQQQARMLMSSLVVVYAETPHAEPVRAFSSIKEEDMSSVYRPTRDIMNNAELRRVLLRRALQDANIWKKRYANLHELAKVFEALEESEKLIA